jgi:hypothetical protein
MLRGWRTPVLAAALTVAVTAGTSRAEDWELELHGGVAWTFSSSGGRATSPPPGESFETVVPGVASRRVSSWYYGEGGALLEQTRTGWGSQGSFTFQYPVTVGSLDALLSSASVGWPAEGGAGLRLGRHLGRHLTAELGLEYAGHAPAFTQAARADLETSRSSFESAWRTTLSSLPGSSAASQLTVADGRGRQVRATAVLNVNLTTGDPPSWSRRSTRKRFVSYLTFGAGIVTTTGEEAVATLVGRYQFASPVGDPPAPFEEADTVTVRSAASHRTAFVGIVGLGWKQDLSVRWGLRFDVRAYLGDNPARIVMDARPSVRPGSPSSVFVANSKVGAIQFANGGSSIGAGSRSSLSGPAITGFETYRGTGMEARVSLTFGVYLRL